MILSEPVKSELSQMMQGEPVEQTAVNDFFRKNQNTIANVGAALDEFSISELQLVIKLANFTIEAKEKAYGRSPEKSFL